MQGQPSQYSDSRNSQIRQMETTFEDKSKAVFQELCQFNENQNTIDLNFLRQIMALNNNKFNTSVMRIITQYKMADAIKQGDFQEESYFKKVLNSEEFTRFITGKDMKTLLFENDNIADKRFSTEEYYKLFELIGGNEKGLSRDTLKNCLTQAVKAMTAPEKYLKDEPINVNSSKIDNEVNEIMEYLSDENGECISIKDFVNAMTSNTPFPKDLDDLLK